MSIYDDLAAGSVFGDLAERWGQTVDFTRDPSAWVERNGESMWSMQKAILESVRDNRYTAVHSAHDLGKSFIASRTIAWWIDSHPVGSAFVVSTAPTAAQVSAIMWREVQKIHSKASLDGRINRAGYPQWVINGELVGYGRKPADYEQSAFQGIHAQYVLVVVDEACGVSEHLFNSVDALATNKYARVLAIGNPDDPSSHFATVCKPDSGWTVFHLDGLRSPNLTKARVIGHKSEGYGYDNPRFPLLRALMEGSGVPYSTEQIPEYMHDMLIDEIWIEERLERWCGLTPTMAREMEYPKLVELVCSRSEGSPLFTSKVRGMFPTSASEGVIPLGWVQLAVNRWHDLHDTDQHIPASLKAHEPGALTLGVDVARSANADETVLALRYGSYVPEIERMRVTDTMEVADRAAAYMHEPGSSAVVDVIGIGSGVYDRLRQMKAEGLIQGTPIPFNAAGQSHRRDKLGQFRFRNDRAAAWWNFRELLDPAFGSQIAIPDDDRLITELITPKFDHFVGGIMTVESKDDIRKKIGRSTDAADAVIQAFWIKGPAGTAEFVPWDTNPHRNGSIVRYQGYDPFTDTDMAVGLGQSHSGNIGASPLSRFADENEWGI